MNLQKLAERMRGNSTPRQIPRKVTALKAAISEVLAEAETSPMFKMALPGLNMITSDSQVDDCIGTVEDLLASYHKHLGE